VGFLDNEFSLAGGELADTRAAGLCAVLDTLVLAREMHPGQRNSLDALCRRYEIENSHRTLHGALLDAEILADVYMAMTGGQATLSLGGAALGEGGEMGASTIVRLGADRPPLPVVHATADECQGHEERLDAIEEASGGACVWRGLSGS